MLPAMSATALLAVFTTGLFAGAVLALGIAFLLRRERRGDDSAATGRLAQLLAPLRTDLERYDSRLALLPRSHSDGAEVAKLRADLRMELIGEERVLIHQLLRRGEISDETRRRIERDLDLEEAAFRTRIGGEGSDQLPL